MEIHELLDRFEILDEENDSLKDLRRSYVDKDLSSIFKITNGNEELRKAVIEQNLHSIFRLVDADEELRKAVIEQNLHSIFRLLEESDDVKKIVLDDNKWSLWKELKKHTNTSFIDSFKRFEVEGIEIDKDCFSRGQLQSKKWLVDELKKLDLDLGVVFLCAGWYATLATMMFEKNLNIKNLYSFDIDPSCEKIAEIFNKKWVMDDWKFKALTADINDLKYSNFMIDFKKSNGDILKTTINKVNTVINTSSEHIQNFNEWYSNIPHGTIVIIQGNDFFEVEEHVNCSEDLEDFSFKVPMGTTLYEGELKLEKYTRFMKIGIK